MNDKEIIRRNLSCLTVKELDELFDEKNQNYAKFGMIFVLEAMEKARQDEREKCERVGWCGIRVDELLHEPCPDCLKLKARWEKLKKYSHDYCLKRNRCALVWQKMQELESGSYDMLPVPDDLAKCQLCGSKNSLKAVIRDIKVKGLPVTEARIVCSACFDRIESGGEVPKENTPQRTKRHFPVHGTPKPDSGKIIEKGMA